jgi:hypothetical protein
LAHPIVLGEPPSLGDISILSTGNGVGTRADIFLSSDIIILEEDYKPWKA